MTDYIEFLPPSYQNNTADILMAIAKHLKDNGYHTTPIQMEILNGDLIVEITGDNIQHKLELANPKFLKQLIKICEQHAEKTK